MRASICRARAASASAIGRGGRQDLHRRQQRRGARLRVWRRDGRGLVSDHAILLAGRGVRALLLATGRTRDATAAFAILQAEDELASIGMAVGAAWNGARAFTATSGPGISLMQEFLGLAYFAEIPAVVFDVQRGGPSTGMPTRTQQSDVLACAYASHGDTKHVLIFPEDPHECFDFAALAFDLVERLQTPIFVLSDLEIGMNERLTAPLAWDDGRRMDRGKVMTEAELEAGREFGRYLDVDGDGIPYRTYPGTHPTRGAFFTRGSAKNRYARYTEDGAGYVDNAQRLLKKLETAKRLVPRPVKRGAPDATRLGTIYYGSTSPAMDEAVEILRASQIRPGSVTRARLSLSRRCRQLRRGP